MTAIAQRIRQAEEMLSPVMTPEQARIMGVMIDGHERTSNDICYAMGLDPKEYVNQVSNVAAKLAARGRLVRDRFKDCTIWRLA